MHLPLTVDAEESERLDMSLDIFAAVFTHPDLKGWPGLGLAVFSFQRSRVGMHTGSTGQYGSHGDRGNQ